MHAFSNTDKAKAKQRLDAPFTYMLGDSGLSVEGGGLVQQYLSEEAQVMSADTMERRLLAQLLALGRALFALFLATRAAATAAPADRDPAGVERPYHAERTRPYLSIFGRVSVTRPYFYRKGAGGRAPVDATLSLPPTVCADLVRETAEELGVGEADHKGLRVLHRLLGLALSTRTRQEQVVEDAVIARRNPAIRYGN
jgi:hypothetical protein